MLILTSTDLQLLTCCKSSIKPPGGLIYFKPIWGGGGGLIETGGYLRGGGLINLKKTKV